jgi:hypothetical protein
VLIEGCVIQVAGLAALTLTVALVEVPTARLLVLAISFFAIEAARSARLALFALSIAACAAFLSWMRRAAPEIWIERHNPGD